jgi:CubicO group peptidase (beta-lactamase class C family)
VSPSLAGSPARVFGPSTKEGTVSLPTWLQPARRTCSTGARPDLWTTCTALLVLCVRLLAPSAARAEDAHDRLGVRGAEFQAIDAYVAAQMEAMHIPGVALAIVRGDEVVHLGSFGVADPAGRPMTAQTPLILGSTGKSITALAVMQLVEAGKLELDAPVQRYLPWFRVGGPDGHSAASAITVRHLLSHVSGIPTGKIIGASLTGTGDETLEDEVRALAAVTLTAPVGTAYQYANSNYVTLGLLVQTVSGQSYEEYVQEHVFAPLRMQQSFVSRAEATRHGLATGYRWWFGVPVPASLPHLPGTLPAGFHMSSARDMAQYLVAQLNGGRYRDTAVLSPTGVTQLHQPAAAMGAHGAGGDAYGMGWVVSTSGEPAVWHGGDTANFHSDVALFPARHLGVVVLMNVNGNLAMTTGAQSVVAQGVQRLLLGEQPPPPSRFRAQYLAFDAALLLVSASAVWSLVKLLRGMSRPRRSGPAGVPGVCAVPLLWEVALPSGLLIGFPSLAQASWPLTLLFFPDLGYWLLGLCGTLLATGSLRVVLALPRLRAHSPGSTTPLHPRSTPRTAPFG